MRRLSRIFACVGLAGALFGVMAGASLSVGASSRAHGPAVIDTDRVIGPPQHVLARDARTDAPTRSAPTITLQPTSQTVAPGAAVTFSAAASGSPTPTVQWRDSTNAGRTWTSIRGATSTSYTFDTTASESGYDYDAVFTNSRGSATTSAATLTVTSTPTAPAITRQPTNQSIPAGSSVTFTAAASGYPTPTVQWYESTDAGSTWNAITRATSTSYSFTASSSQSGDEFDAVFTNSRGSATTNAATLKVTITESSNWSGYADIDATFTAVSATFKVPTIACAGKSSTYSAQWVGIDGYTSDTVEQDGIEADCLSGSNSYDAWYEMYGDSKVDGGDEVELSPTKYPVEPNDTIDASVSVTGSSWTLSLEDVTENWSYTPSTITFSAARSSAEWVVERPELCSGSRCSLTSLSNFGSTSFTSASATTSSGPGTISSYVDSAMEMVNGSTPLAVPGTLDPAGDSFTDTYE